MKRPPLIISSVIIFRVYRFCSAALCSLIARTSWIKLVSWLINMKNSPSLSICWAGKNNWLMPDQKLTTSTMPSTGLRRKKGSSSNSSAAFLLTAIYSSGYSSAYGKTPLKPERNSVSDWKTSSIPLCWKKLRKEMRIRLKSTTTVPLAYSNWLPAPCKLSAKTVNDW